MFSDTKRLQGLEDSLATLRGQMDLLRVEWADWRRQLMKAAARLERAQAREKQHEEPAEQPVVDRMAQLNAEILRARGEGRAPQVAGNGAGAADGLAGARSG